MNPEIKALWLTELRSGKYTQVKSSLRYNRDDGSVGYCCLGVLCELAVKAGVVERVDPEDDFGDSRYQTERHWEAGESSTAYLPQPVMDWAGLDTHDAIVPGLDIGDPDYSLAVMNDDGKTFAEIADVIEEKF